MTQENELKEEDGCKPSAPVPCSTPSIDYFVTYWNPTGRGRCSIRRSAPIRSIEDIESIEADIEKKRGDKILILNWHRFEA